ncbi:MAG: glycosyltransferase [Fidelibacterota bacterium]|nr:MAG: glycosyltransferase [Candidatus Neomarinimicrobiota bacterium]
MKILVATSSHRPDDDRIYHKQIISMLDAGIEVLLATRNQKEFRPGLAQFHHTDLAAPSLKAFAVSLQELTDSFQPDILIIHELDLLLPATRIRRQQNIPLIYDVHEAHRELWDLVSSRRFPIKQIINWGLERFERSLLKHVDHVFTVSPPLKVRYERWGRPTTLIPNFPRLDPAPTTKPRHPVVIYAGQLSIQRGLAQLIQAFARVLDRKPDARLEIVGPERIPGLHERLQGSVANLGLDNNVSIGGFVSQEVILQRLTEVQVGVIPFIDHPVFHVALPIKLFEYMLCGCAVVASDLSMIRQYTEGAVALVPPGNVDALGEALASLLLDNAQREELTQRGREMVEAHYNWSQVESVLLPTLEAIA